MATYTDYFSLKRPSGSENVLVSDLNQNTTKIDLIMHQNRQMSADAYDTTETYNTGAIVIYENMLYKCNADNVTGNWDSTKWDNTTLAEEIMNGGGGGGDASKTELTQAEYDALVQAGTVDPDMMYFITDGQGGGGGGGGSSYTETTLWSDANGQTFSPSSPYSLTLSDSMDNYDALCFEVAPSSAGEYRGHIIVPVSMIDKTGTNFFLTVSLALNINSSPSALYVDNTHLTMNGCSSQAPMTVYKIIGIKYGGGGGGSNQHTYSTEEQVVGTWIDGSTVYEKTIDLGSDTTIGSNGYDITTFIPSNIDRVISCEGQCDTYRSSIPLLIDSPSNQIWHIYSGILTIIRHITIRYTKTTS